MAGSDYPECERLAARREDSHKLGDFLDWLAAEHNIVLVLSNDKLLADYFKIDLEQVDREQRRMLDKIFGENETDRA